ncbi:helix-turn-helix transcriptional regulator [Tritonibacter horizontis]|uniref:Urease operon transcriptional activator n=1 Tax=Tritonibacter horizontis TaxID=1768241 RepID=A0A132BWS9_9RHOB|nr:AraC family transcriptional regulator [Tritonibacter horizontis]KUP92845.1 urease operon transcriptional activator [Tritonibacter horizontis]
MDFYVALGLPSADLDPETAILPALASSRAPVVATVIAVPDPVVICEKLLRLDRYCATGVQLRLEESTSASLRLHAAKMPDDTRLAHRFAILKGLLLRAGFTGVTVLNTDPSSAILRWETAPALPPLETGGSVQLTDHVHRLIASDPARAWRIEDIAQHLGLSSRSLQRYLLAEGGTFSVALRLARTEVATNLLRKNALSLAEIGFCCGYADQAHFQREFRKVAGLTPRQYRNGGGNVQKTVRMVP